MISYIIYILLCLYLLMITITAEKGHDLGQHTHNWAILVSTSRYWFNYRHMANALSLYRTVKELGIPDSNIILMLPDDMPCNARNKAKGQVFNNLNHATNLYGSDIEVDYRGLDVSVESFLRLLTGRHTIDTPRSKRLLSDENSHVLVYMAGHGGDEFLKFQDQEEISSYDLADAFEQMHQQKRYRRVLFMVDTCQAATLPKRMYSPGIVAIGSSKLGENSYSHHVDPDIGLTTIDRFTYYTLEFFEQSKQKQPSVQQLFNTYQRDLLYSNIEYREDLFDRPLSKVPVSDFFSAVSQVQTTPFAYTLTANRTASTRSSAFVPAAPATPVSASVAAADDSVLDALSSLSLSWATIHSFLSSPADSTGTLDANDPATCSTLLAIAGGIGGFLVIAWLLERPVSRSAAATRTAASIQ